MATPAYVQGVYESPLTGTSGYSTPGLSSTTTSGNTIVVGVVFEGESSVSISDSGGNTYSQLLTQAKNPFSLYFFAAQNINATSSLSVTIDFSATQLIDVFVMEVSGLATSGSLVDQSASSSYASGTTQTLTLPSSTTVANDFLIAMAMDSGSGDTWTPESGYTLFHNSNNYTASEYQGVNATSDYSASMTLNTSGSNYIIIMMFAALKGGSSSSSLPIAASLSGSSSLTAKVSIPLSAVLSGDSSLSANVLGKMILSASLSGSSTLTANVLGSMILSATISGSSTINAAVVTAIPLSSSLSGASSLTANVEQTIKLNASLSGSSALTAQISANMPLSSNLVGSSSVTANVLGSMPLSSALIGSSALTANVLNSIPLASSLSGSSSLSASINISFPLSSALSGSSSISASVVDNKPLTGPLSGSSSLSATYLGSIPLASSLSGLSSLTSSINVEIPLNASLSGSSSITASLISPGTALPINATLTGSSSMTSAIIIGVISIPANGTRLSTQQITSCLDVAWWLKYFLTGGVSWPSSPIYFQSAAGINLVFSYNWYGLPVPAGDSPSTDTVYNQIISEIIPFTAVMLREYACAGNISNVPPA